MSAPVDVLAVLDWAAEQVVARAACASDANRFATAEALRNSRTAIAELIEQQKRDAVLVDVLLSYLNDNLSEREKGRLGAELMTRDLSDHRDRRAAALCAVSGEVRHG